jgi:hypothetical protein
MEVAGCNASRRPQICRMKRSLNSRYDRPVSPQRERDVGSNIVACLPSGKASQSFGSWSDLGWRPFIPSKTSRNICAWVFSAFSFSSSLIVSFLSNGARKVFQEPILTIRTAGNLANG